MGGFLFVVRTGWSCSQPLLATWLVRPIYSKQRVFHGDVAHMDMDLENVIRQALADAQAAGKDQMSQTVLAVQAVQRARPDMTASDALAAVTLVQQS